MGTKSDESDVWGARRRVRREVFRWERAVMEEGQFLPPLCQPEEQAHEEHGELEPVGGHHAQHNRSAPDPEHETGRDRHHVEDHLPFERERVGGVQDQVKAAVEGLRLSGGSGSLEPAGRHRAQRKSHTIKTLRGSKGTP